MKTLAQAGEAWLLGRVVSWFDGPGLTVGIGDDGAVYPVKSQQVAVVDAMMESIHFDTRLSPANSIGRKLVAVNVSDIAAMGASPTTGLLTIGAPGSTPCEWIESLLSGVAFQAHEYGMRIVGGDVTGSPGPIALGLTVLGELDGAPLRRTAAQPGDAVYVTGQLGGAAAGLRVLRGNKDLRTDAVARFLTPVARVSEALMLNGRCAVMDLSDGLLTDAERLARASGVRLEIDLSSLPRHPEATQDEAVSGGEDYELLIVAPGPPPFPAHRIGAAHSGEPGVRWLWGRQDVKPTGSAFSHFGE